MESETALRRELEGCAAAAVVLLPWQNAPQYVARDDGSVTSFLCSETVLNRLTAHRPDALPEQLCCLLLKAILSGNLLVDRLLIRQLPYPAGGIAASDDESPTAVLMAHRGRVDHLRTALRYLPPSGENGLAIRVGLDTEDPAPYRPLAASVSRVEFYRGIPAPAGPYAIRQKLAELSPERLLMFHDSDDVSCTDRLSRLRPNMAAAECGMIGCHELVVDEIRSEVRAVRYPLDVSEALRDGPHYSFLHGTSMIGRQAFFAAGGFSTDRIISCDTQFLYRAWFHMQIRNADDFLYIRRRHAESLTVQGPTKIGSDFRRAIEQPWGPDFEAVKSGKLPLAKSTLMAVPGSAKHELVPLA